MGHRTVLGRESNLSGHHHVASGSPQRCIVAADGDAATTGNEQICRGLTEDRAIQRILVALGGAPGCDTKLPLAETMARAFGAELILLHVLQNSSGAKDESISPEEARAGAYLQMIAARMHAAGLHVHGITRVAPSVADAIVAEARDQKVDLIILGFDVRRGLPRAFRKNVADEVARRAPAPVVLVRPEPGAVRASTVRSFDEDAAYWGPLSRWDLGVRPVTIARIIGSVGRPGEPLLDSGPIAMAQLKGERRLRLKSILAAMRKGVALPAVQLYKLGGAHYVLDGNHRIAAARSLGQLEIDAEVTEFVPLDDSTAQRVFAERRLFERQTRLIDIDSAHLPGTYPKLQNLIDEFVAEGDGADGLHQARRWYTRVYLPLARSIRDRDLTRRFPGEHISDVVARIAIFRCEESARRGCPIDLSDAIDLFVEQWLHRNSPISLAG